MATRFSSRMIELSTFVQGVKQDIKDRYKELGYRSEFVKFPFTCSPKDYIGVSLYGNVLILKDNDGDDWHEDNVNNPLVLLNILKAMYHLQPLNNKVLD